MSPVANGTLYFPMGHDTELFFNVFTFRPCRHFLGRFPAAIGKLAAVASGAMA